MNNNNNNNNNRNIPDLSRESYNNSNTKNNPVKLKYVNNRSNHFKEKKVRLSLKKIKKTLKITIGTIAIVITACGINNKIHRDQEKDINPSYNNEYSVNKDYSFISIQVPKNKYNSVEEIADDLYNHELYNCAFGNKEVYLDYLKQLDQDSYNYINAKIIVNPQDDPSDSLDSLLFQMSREDKWINYTVENGDSVWYYRESAVVDGFRDVDDALRELMMINNWETLPKLSIGDHITIYNPKRINLERQYYETVNNLIDNYKVETDKTK